MRPISHNVDVKAPQLDGIKAHIRNNQFVYGLAAGFVLATVLSHRQTINISIPRVNY